MLSQRLKQRILASPAGSAALRSRDALDLARAWRREPDLVGWWVADMLAVRLMSTICRPGKTFVDVGAHLGSMLVEVMRGSPQARLVAVEADPAKAGDLAKRFAQVKVHACAVGDAPGTLPFYIPTGQTGYSSLLESSATAHGADVQVVQVPVQRLDDLIGDDEPIDAMKIDVEGVELAVLRGAQRVLKRCRPLLLYESKMPDDPTGSPALAQMHEFLTAHDYDVLLPHHVLHAAPGLGLEAYRHHHWYPCATTNYFALPKERRAEFCARARQFVPVRDN